MNRTGTTLNGKAALEAAAGSAGSPASPRLRRIFDALREDEAPTVSPRNIARVLEAAGLRLEDGRLGDLGRSLRARRNPIEAGPEDMDLSAFEGATHEGLSLLEKVLRRDLVLPDFDEFRREVATLFAASAVAREGEVAHYIPQLARVDPEHAALGLCTVDGQRMALGDHDRPFCLQSSCKPINYAIALEQCGTAKVHAHVGREPSGRSFNELSLNHEGHPHNPMINAGAIMSCALIGRDEFPADRFDSVLSTWEKLTGGVRPGFDNSVFLSERRTADRNFALAYFMREHGAFPEGTDIAEILEFYFQCCSLELTADDFGVVAATLANGGVCPLTDERVFSAETVRHTLSLMDSCGLYDFSGEWAFTVGLPAKSGVSGVILVVVPGTLGFAVWSPRLDRNGNSVRGIAFCQELLERFDFHHYDGLLGGRATKADPRRDSEADESLLLGQLLWAASRGDVSGMRRAAVRGLDLAQADYDGRTALHLAASEGRREAVDYLLDQGVPISPVDRWGGTPVDDARRENHLAVVERLEAAAAR